MLCIRDAFPALAELPPACYLTYDHGTLQVHRYWKLHAAPHTDSPADTIEHTHQLVTDAVERDFGRIDILIHTSAVAQVCDTLHPDDAELKNTLETNFIGSVHINETVSAVMVKNGFGRIINSIDAFSVNCVDGMSYACSKAALMQATKNFAVSLADKGVTVNGVAPVWIWTPMMAKRPGDYMKQAAASVPMGRVSYAEDYLGMLFFLASPASAYVTGQTFLVDGGWSVSRVFQYSND